jgi:hypothetical protein
MEKPNYIIFNADRREAMLQKKYKELRDLMGREMTWLDRLRFVVTGKLEVTDNSNFIIPEKKER